MPQDKFKEFHTSSLTTPATSLFTVIPDDVADLPWVTISLNVATPGTVRVTLMDGSIGDLTVRAGVVFPIRVSRVWATGTTATGIVGLT